MIPHPEKNNTENSAAIIVLNAGSSSLKFGLYHYHKNKPECITQGSIQDLDGSTKFTVDDNKNVTELPAVNNHQQAICYLLNWLEISWPNLYLAGAGHRVVHGGAVFSAPVLIDSQVMQQLHDYSHLAPLHLPHNLAAIKTLQQQRPQLQQVACFDTAFHRTMPWYEQHYALPREWFDKGVQHYGFHGLSYEYISAVLPDYLGAAADGKVIVAHLGHGASLCALRQRRSVATTMGFTPLDGIPMATRSGALDPGIISWLIREAGLSITDIDTLLNEHSGLLGLSGISGDMRLLLADKHRAAAEAIDYFIHHTHRAIASLAATLGGLDALVFTAGIGENAAIIRERICAKAAWLGLQINHEANNKNQRQISTTNSKVSIWCIPTNEELIIAQHSCAIIENTTHGENQ